MASPILRDVFNQRREHWGEDDDGHTFERPPGGPQPLARVDVFVYRASDETPMTTLATVGMCSRPQPGNGTPSELHVAVRGRLDPKDERSIAVQLANLASFPWTAKAPVSWGHIIPLTRPFPLFPMCKHVFLSGPFTPSGWDWIDTSEGRVRILNVVPITEAERSEAKEMGPIDFLSSLLAEVDIFSPRPAP